MSNPKNCEIGLQATSLATDSVAPIDGVHVAIWVDWDRQPVCVHGDTEHELNELVAYLRQQHNLRKRSLVMPNREVGGYLFFLYQSCDPRWIASFVEQQ